MLSSEDREALGDWWDDETTVGIESAYPVVHRIVAAHVTAALNEAEGWVAMEAAKHVPEKGGGCICGFCAWSVEHVARMSYRDGVRRSHRNRTPT